MSIVQIRLDVANQCEACSVLPREFAREMEEEENTTATHANVLIASQNKYH